MATNLRRLLLLAFLQASAATASMTASGGIASQMRGKGCTVQVLGTWKEQGAVEHWAGLLGPDASFIRSSGQILKRLVKDSSCLAVVLDGADNFQRTSQGNAWGGQKGCQPLFQEKVRLAELLMHERKKSEKDFFR